jgi:hypothetical protein
VAGKTDIINKEKHMKYIKIERCIDCPWFYEGDHSDLCTKDPDINFDDTNIYKEIHKDCPLEDYPETITELLRGKV